MRKLFLLGALFALVFAACENGTTDSESKTTRLKIKNESFTELTGVIWQGVSFESNSYENSIKTGTTISHDVSAGSGYIFFKRKSNPINARTNELVIVEEGGDIEFTFTDNTVIAEVNNTGNNGTLGALQSTVVFFDDAEGEMQQYFEKQTFVGYYDMDTPLYNGSIPSQSYYVEISAVKNGKKSIAVGGLNTAKLHLRIDLAKATKLSFWLANKADGSNGTTFSINGTANETWTNSLDWSFKTYTLAAGQTDLVWEKKDGGSGYYYSYLSLDDILIYYTE
jgi:hypothetical protein